MIEEAHELALLLEDGPLAGRPVEVVDLPRSGERVLTVPVDVDDLLAQWRAGRALLDRTGRWPVVASAWGAVTSAPTAETFWMDPRGEKPPPPDLRAAARGLTGEAAIAAMRAAGGEYPELVSAYLDWHLDATRERCRDAPSIDEITAVFADGGGRLVRRWLGARTPGQPAEVDLERWLMDWEEQRNPTTEPEHVDFDDWFYPVEGEGSYLLFVPTRVGAEALAYMEFYAEDGVLGADPPRLIATLDSWEQRFGAELVAHWGTMLQFVVDRPPQTLEEAWPIALEHQLIAPGTLALPGITVRDHARTLWRRPTWFLHERP